MILVELGVNSSMEELPRPSSGVCQMPCKPASVSRNQSFGDAAQQTILQMHKFTQPQFTQTVSAILLQSR
jgi:hypothetical protein